jgi:anti-sigma-K factor RskA
MPEIPDQPGVDDLDELAELRALADRLELEPEAWEAPPADLWDRIAADAGTDAGTGPAAGVTSLDRHRSRRRGWALGAAAAAAAAVVIGVVVVQGGDDEPEVLAATDLELLGDAGSGRAELVDDGGTLRLRVDAEDLDAGDGFLEVWVIDPEVTQLVSLGPLRPDGLYDLPPGLDPQDFPIVDVSVEPLDGDPTHSGASVLRGQLEF